MSAPRRATPGDVDALVRLRAVLAGEVGVADAEAIADERWRSAAAWWFAEKLDRDEDFAAVVVERDGRVVAGAAGRCVRGAPSPENPTGYYGYLLNVVTEPAWRRQRLATACVEALIDWFTTGTRAAVVMAEASGAAAELHRSLGFAAGGGDTLRRVLAH